MNSKSHDIQWGENVIIADGEYIDSVAFNLTVNFERMIGRHIPQADMAQWVECIALDGGCKRQEDEKKRRDTRTHVIIIHDKAKEELDNFNPGRYEATGNTETATLDAQAFMGETGEYLFHCIASDEKMETMTKGDILTDVLAHLADEEEVKRIMVIPDLETEEKDMMQRLMPVLRHLDREHSEKRVTLFAMQPLTGMPCRTEILGYSLLAALGIRAEELQ